MTIIGLLIILGGIFYLLRVWYSGANYLVPIVIILTGLLFYSFGKILKRKPEKYIALDGDKKDRHVKKIEDEARDINKWYEKDHH